MTKQPPPVPESVRLAALGTSAAQEMPIIAIDLPVLYEDEGQEQMGETLPHSLCIEILATGIAAHLAPRPEYRVLENMNLYYHPIDRWAYVSPDVMAVKPSQPLPDGLRSYRIGKQGPAPVLAVEVLSRRSFQQQDLTNKPVLYAERGVAEYLLVDVTGEFMPELLLMKRLQDDQTWKNEQDADGGVTSQLGFRVVIEEDGQLRVIDTATGKRYLRPSEAQAAADALIQTQIQLSAREKDLRERDERIRLLEEELNRLRSQPEKKE